MTKTDLESLRAVLLRGQEAGVAAITGPECAYLTDLLFELDSLNESLSTFATVIALADDEGAFCGSLMRIIQNELSMTKSQVDDVLHTAQILWSEVSPVKENND